MAPSKRKQKRQLATEIAIAIRDGAYRSGEWLRQIDLEKTFTAKRFEVRSALAELVLRGAVEHVANRGFCVAVPDVNQTRELLAVRMLLEVEAATLAMPNIRTKEMREIKTHAEAFEKAIVDGGTAEQSRTNASFHDAIYQHARNRKLVELVVEMRDRSIPWPIILWPSHSSLQRSAADHRAILTAIDQQDAKSLVRALRNHIIRSEPHYARHGYDAPPDGEGAATSVAKHALRRVIEAD